MRRFFQKAQKIPSVPYRGGSGRGSGIRKNLALLLASTALACGLGEVFARIKLPAPLPWRYPQVRYRADPTLVFTLQPDQAAFSADKSVRINARGLRGSLSPYGRIPGRMRILFLGDSIVFGYGVGDKEVVSARTSDLLAHRGIPSEAINTGVPSYNTEQETEFLATEGMRYRPDWVIVGVCWNDINAQTGVVVSEEGWLGNRTGDDKSLWLRMSESPTGYAVRNALKQSRLLYGVFEGWRSLSRGRHVDDHTLFMMEVLEGRETHRVSDGWNRFGAALHRLAELSHRQGFRTLVVTFPPALMLEEHFPKSSYPSRVRALAEGEGLPFLDLEEAFRLRYRGHESLFIPYDNDHPNAVGHDLAAREIARFLAGRGERVPTRRKWPVSPDFHSGRPRENPKSSSEASQRSSSLVDPPAAPSSDGDTGLRGAMPHPFDRMEIALPTYKATGARLCP